MHAATSPYRKADLTQFGLLATTSPSAGWTVGQAEQQVVDPVEILPLPVRIRPVPGEAIDSFLEHLASANHAEALALLREAGADLATYLPITVAEETLTRIAAMSGQATHVLGHGLLATRSGIDAFQRINGSGAEAGTAGTGRWRHVGRAWAPGRSSQLCPACLAADGAWRISWRHPWITTCLHHRIWLHATCPACGLPFRSQRHPLRSIDAIDGTCANPAGKRGQGCEQALHELDQVTAPSEVIASQRRIHSAIDRQHVDITGETVEGEDYLAELKSLTVLLLHLARQPGAERLAPWAPDARADHNRSAAGRGARWALAPPADPILRGRALTAADQILTAPDTEEAAQRLGPWVDFTPPVAEGQLGWLADHTTTTPLATKLIMAATSTRRRLSTLLAQHPPIEPRLVPQVLPADLYGRHLTGLLDVTDTTGRLFASLCLTRLGHPGLTWADAATTLGLPADLGTKTARACSADLLCSAPAFVETVCLLGAELPGSGPSSVDYAERAQAVQRLATRARWYRTWAHHHTPGARAASRAYAITWLWTEYAAGHLTTSPAWTSAPKVAEQAHYRRYAARLDAAARQALVALVATSVPDTSSRR